MPESENGATGFLLDGKERPACFGDPSQVCPKDGEGIIQPQAGCVSCGFLKNCLQQALRRDGLLWDSSGQQLVSKSTHFLKRWSNRKLAHKDRQDHPSS
jgi:hypothetical protein